MRRLTSEELFHIGGPTGLEEISDDTLRQRLDAAEMEMLRESAECSVDGVNDSDE